MSFSYKTLNKINKTVNDEFSEENITAYFLHTDVIVFLRRGEIDRKFMMG